MPPQPLFDFSHIDTDNVLISRDEIYQVNPHRYEFQQLDGICYIDREQGRMVGFREVRDDEFWVRGHIPGRPLFPGVLMIESAAQLVSYYAMSDEPEGEFLGFGAVDGVKFRGSVVPGQRIVLLGRMVEMRRRRCIGDTQAFVDGAMVYEGRITGMWL
ncbi:MAG: 3-hydroxyacyl-ACP dehydratase FabZ family protein [Phycisphaerae bacterium]